MAHLPLLTKTVTSQPAIRFPPSFHLVHPHPHPHPHRHHHHPTQLTRNQSRLSSTEPRHSSRYNYNPDPFSADDHALAELLRHFSTPSHQLALADAHSLARFHHPPTPSISLARDFIENSLYNPHYGYFPTQAEILDRPAPDQLQERTSGQFERDLDADYATLAGQPTGSFDNPTQERQVWHTPTELLKPWYARTVARYILKDHFHSSSPQSDVLEPLKIYEIGAGNGTLCQGILDYIQEVHPDLYPLTSYTTIEVSSRLADRQRSKASRAGHEARVQVLNQSVLHPDITPDPTPCWVLGMEVLDNLTRDVIRWDRLTGEPLQSIVITDEHGDYHERFMPITPASNPVLLDYLALRLNSPPPLARTLDRLTATYVPFASNLSEQEFVPTSYSELFKQLFRLFPRHKLLLSDFDYLPHALPGTGAPVVQTRYNGMTVPATTFLVKPGAFDIFFPTDFASLLELYSRLKPPSVNAPLPKVFKHQAFCQQFIEPGRGTLKDGTSVLSDYYQNVKVLAS